MKYINIQNAKFPLCKIINFSIITKVGYGLSKPILWIVTEELEYEFIFNTMEEASKTFAEIQNYMDKRAGHKTWGGHGR